VTHDLEAALTDVGAIVEEPKFHPHLTGRENLEVVASLRSEQAWNAIADSLVRVGLGGREDERVGGYSLGMRQRLGIARCLLTDPRLIILDEPMNGLDPPGIAEIRALIRELVEEGKTVLISSHLLDEIERTCDDVAILSFGQVLAAGSLESILEGRVRSITLRTSDDDGALSKLVGLDGFRSVTRDQGGIRVDLGDGDGAHGADVIAAKIARELVTSGLDLYQLAVNAVTLEERFFEMTGTGAEGTQA
jgi:ABC-2 type transport system ATP-binding protein